MKSKNEGSEKQPNQQMSPFDWDAFNKQSLLNLRQCLILNLQLKKQYYGTYSFVTKDDIAKSERELAAFYEREDVKKLLYPASKITPPVVVTKQKPPRKKTIHLICINDGPMVDKDGEIIKSSIPIAFLDRYTSTGKEIDKHGRWCYPINELGARFLAERFIVSKSLGKK